MKITELAIKNKVVTLTIVILAFIGGIFSYFSMPKAEDPGFTIRSAIVVTYFPGASPKRVEELVTDKIEEAVSEIPEIKEVKSTSKNGFSMVTVEVSNKYDDMQPVWDKLRRKVSNLSLPSNTIGPFVNDEFGDVYGSIIGVSGEGYTPKELKKIADNMKDELLTIPNVAKVNIIGNQEERIFVEYKNDKLAEIGVSPYQLQQILEATNIVIPGGSIYIDSEMISLEPSGNFNSIEDLEQTIISIPNSNQSFYLKDIARVYKDYPDPIESEFRVNNKSGIALAISMKDDGNIVELGKNIKNKLKSMEEILPVGVDAELVSFQPSIVENKINSFSASLIQSIITVVFVLLIFLGLRTGFLIAAMIPIIVSITFLIMSFFNIMVEQVSLAAIIIALGMLVDNAIVVSESIMVKMENGEDVISAVKESSSELVLPLLISSLTTCCAFLPIGLAQSDVGEFCKSLFQVISITLIVSWVLSMTLIPLLCVLYIKVQKKEETYNGPIYKKYKSGLIFLLKKKYLSLIVMIIILVFGVIGINSVPFIFIPNADKPIMTATFKMPGGTSIKQTQVIMKDIDKYIKNNLEVENKPKSGGIIDLFLTGGTTKKYPKEGITTWGTFIGESAPRFYLSFSPELSSPEYSFMLINLTSDKVIPKAKKMLEEYVENKYPDMDLTITKLEMGPPVGKPIQIKLKGKDVDKLYKITEQIKQIVRDTEGTKNIQDDWGLKSKKVIVDINQSKARKANMTSQDVAGSLYTMIDGYNASSFRENTDVTPIILRAKESRNNNFSDIENAKIFSLVTGQSVNLSQIADIKFAWEPSVIYRTDSLKTITITADLRDGYNSIEMLNTKLIPVLEKEKVKWGYGYSYEIGGELETTNESIDSIIKVLPIAVMLITLLLVIQFNSYKKIAVIVSLIPFIIIPISLTLVLSGRDFGFMPLLGLIALAGITINTAIVLMDRIDIEMKEGKDLHIAIVDSCITRLRPIILTTSTTICGLIPLWLSGGPLFSTMALTMMNGLIFVILLVLVILPLIFSIYYKVDFNSDNKEY